MRLLLPAVLAGASLWARALADVNIGLLGTHSESFDAQKYSLLDRLLITPDSHPNLFSFTGRWQRSPTAHPHSPAYHATLWPGNSVTILFFGDKASLKLLPGPQGWIERYSFVVSVDGEEDVRYDTPGFDSETNRKEGHYIPLQFSKPPKGDKHMMEPHTVRVTSISATPFSFEGLLVEITRINQGKEWALQQSRRPMIEFVGEGLDAERPGGFFRWNEYVPTPGETVEASSDALFSTLQWQIGEQLGVRHAHMSAGVCLLDNCVSAHPVPGLGQQYFYTSPLNNTFEPVITNKFDPRHIENRMALYRFPSMSTKPVVPISPVTHLVVDTGVYDMLRHGQNKDKYAHALTVFLARLRNQAHPDAKILVVARRGIPEPALTTIPADNPEIRKAREDLYGATELAVRDTGDNNTYFMPVALSALEEPTTSYLRALCPHILPPVGILQSSKAMAFLRGVKNWSIAENVCIAIEAQAYRRRSQAFFWGCLFVGMVAGALWIARSTVIGALAAIVGRRRLGLSEDEHRLLSEDEERDGHGKLG